ncbi:MAG: FAD-dependent oxidoreductase [Candidatus Omnitrophica bacterium]|nr:hypothetical protein [bacterium]NUN95137.1 FAD-dependent oxidoreductase [Candidatus Omnitrophota bacterium]
MRACLYLSLVVSTLLPPYARASERFDVVVIGGTPGGIASALAAARHGRSVALVEYHAHLGGMTTSGLGKSDIETTGAIGGIWDEFVRRVYSHYLESYGADSEQVKACRQGYFYEPSVAEKVLNRMVAEHPAIQVFVRHRLEEVVRNGMKVVSVRVKNRDSGEILELRAGVFVDATYEGDLLAGAGAEYRLGREGRADFGEVHAGVIYMDHQTRAFLPGSTGEGDMRLPAYTYRLCLSSDPANQMFPERPPDYDRNRYSHYLLDLKLGRLKSAVDALSIAPVPNRKHDANMKPWPLGFPFAEENVGYPEASWEKREEIMARIRNLTLGLLYFLQNDPEVPEADRARARQYGLAADEFTDNGNFPFQFYVREARRLVGEYTLSERDLTYAPESFRAPVHDDSISAGEFPIDAFPTRKYEPGREAALEGYILMLKQFTRPYQIPYRTLVPKEVEGLIVPVAVSATHIGFSSVRLEPTWMSLGQAAGTAAHLALELGVPLRKVPIPRLQRELIRQRQVISYFEDVPKDSPYFECLQFLGTKGFFQDYQARPDDPLSARDGKRWVELILAAAGRAEEPFPGEESDQPLSESEFSVLLHSTARKLGLDPEQSKACKEIGMDAGRTLTRVEACQAFHELLGEVTE